jgi:hypothetical protein
MGVVMRADMGKVLVERPRLGGWRFASRPAKGYAKRLRKCLDAGDSPPAREGMKQRHGHGTKHFNEHLAPLRRFLDSNVGRPWNKVYSEICRHVDRGNVVQKHILTHLFDYVAVHTVLIDGEPCRGDGWGYGRPLRSSHRYYQWYVCPKSGLLRRSRYVPYRQNRVEQRRHVVLNKRQVCIDRDGEWELITVMLIEQPDRHVPPAYDVILERQVDRYPTSNKEALDSHAGNKYKVQRRALSRKELLALPIPVEWLP